MDRFAADKQINNAIAAGLTPLVTVWRAPRWAETAALRRRGGDGRSHPALSATSPRRSPSATGRSITGRPGTSRTSTTSSARRSATASSSPRASTATARPVLTRESTPSTRRNGRRRRTGPALQDPAAPVHPQALLPLRHAQEGRHLPRSSRRMVASSLYERRALREAGQPRRRLDRRSAEDEEDLDRREVSGNALTTAELDPVLDLRVQLGHRRPRSRRGPDEAARALGLRGALPGVALGRELLRLAPAARPPLPRHPVPVGPLLLRERVDER